MLASALRSNSPTYLPRRGREHHHLASSSRQTAIATPTYPCPGRHHQAHHPRRSRRLTVSTPIQNSRRTHTRSSTTKPSLERELLTQHPHPPLKVTALAWLQRRKCHSSQNYNQETATDRQHNAPVDLCTALKSYKTHDRIKTMQDKQSGELDSTGLLHRRQRKWSSKTTFVRIKLRVSKGFLGLAVFASGEKTTRCTLQSSHFLQFKLPAHNHFRPPCTDLYTTKNRRGWLIK